jgi:hypothetical protein
MSTAHQRRALEMLETGEGADCVIEVVQGEQEQGQSDGQQNKVYFQISDFQILRYKH